MGSVASKTSRVTVRTGKSGSERVTVSLPTSHITKGTMRQEPQFDTSRRQDPSEWGETLKRVSDIIQSTKWTGTPTAPEANMRPPARAQQENPRVAHIEKSSSAKSSKNPSSHGLDADIGTEISGRHGQLTKENTLLLFHLRRQDSAKWDIQTLSKRFNVSSSDISNLLSFSRTYLGRVDHDGIVRGYYNPNKQNTIVRFERD